MSQAVVLPAAVRARVLALAAERLSTLAEDLVPLPVRPYRRFTARRRAQLAAVPLAAALEADPAFRQLVGEGLPDDLVAAVRGGVSLPAAPPEELGAAAYLLRPPGWQGRVAEAAAALADRDRVAAGAAEVSAVQRLTEQLEAVRAQGRDNAAALAAQLQAAQAGLGVLRRRVREAGSRVAAAARALAAGGAAHTAPLVGPTHAADPADDTELRRLAARLRAAEQALAAERTATRTRAREDRQGEQIRRRVLLDALGGAAGGLRRELAQPPLTQRPGDAVAAAYAQQDVAPGRQGRGLDDPVLLEALLRAPTAHLL
ncbi:MAG: RNA-binding protein, partial [Pseudorhodobacter sp.]|nr:RNA-binding protein [Frankiaceae bacterium]